ncbi:hypothetical protein L0A91_13160 [Ornithinimicrobium sp. INDO-MA30-4]|nr:hypothetical protein [Ornithinimicrobium sp. INDO-MA30-4]UJH70132.1 hypothetical protein L0A91_13160 [Ornithinimicrobium sp. INDO-MA30-4]
MSSGLGDKGRGGPTRVVGGRKTRDRIDIREQPRGQHQISIAQASTRVGGDDALLRIDGLNRFAVVANPVGQRAGHGAGELVKLRLSATDIVQQRPVAVHGARLNHGHIAAPQALYPTGCGDSTVAATDDKDIVKGVYRLVVRPGCVRFSRACHRYQCAPLDLSALNPQLFDVAPLGAQPRR